MALKVADRVKQLTNTTGSGTIALASTPAGFQSFGSVLSDDDTTYYVLVENDDFEIGVGTYSSNNLARSHILQSSNSDNIIPLGGSGTVFIGYPADKSVYQNEESQVVVGASGLILSNSTIIKDGKITELTDVDSSGTPTSTHLMSFNITNYGLTIGNQTGWSNGNTLIGHHAGSGLTTGSDSTMVGYQAGNRNQAGNNNTFIGHQAGPTHPSVGTTIYNSTALGYQAGNKMGVNSTAIGYQSALSTNNTGFVSVGVSTGSGLGADAVAVGRSAGHDLNEQYAVAIGYQAGYEGGGISSAWLGHAAGHSSNGATRSIGLGYQAGKSTTGDDCIYLGNSAGQSNTTDDYFYVANAAPASNGTLIKGDMTNKRVAVGKADITLDSTLHVGINTATHVGLIVKSASAQSADLTQWQNAAGSSVAAMAKSGVLTVNGLYASGAGVQIASATPAVTTNAIYNIGGTLYFNGETVSVGASDTATYASGQALSLTYASGLTATNASNITTVTSTANYASGQVLSLTYASGLTATNSTIANYASGQALSLTHASGLTATNATNITSATNIANYASGQSLSLSHASGIATSLVNSSGIATYASGQALSLTHASGLTATNATNITSVTSTANYASGQVLSLATASGVATYASGVVRGGVAKFNKVGINTDTSPYGIQVVGAGASGLIEATGVLVGNSGVVLANNTPGVTTNTLYNVGGDLYFNGSQLASGGGASATATYASGQALSLTYASGLTATNASTANYASGQVLSLAYASGLTPNIATNTAIANYASGQALSLTYASGLTVTNSAIANYASGQSLSLTHASGLTATNAGNITTVTATANYASGQALSLTTASGIAAYSSGVVTGGIANLNKLGINTGSPAYGVDVTGGGASGVIQASGIKLGASGIIFSNGTTQTVAGALSTVDLTAGDGLTGGGTLASNRTFAVGAGTLIDVQANQVDVDLSEAAAATIAHGDNLIFLDGGATGAASKGSTDDLANLLAGDGLTKSNSVMAVNVDDSTIETNSDAIRVKDNGITLAKMAGLARGKIIYGDSSGDPAALTAGGANTVLTSDGTDVSWGSVPVNSYVSGVAAYASGQVNATAGTATASKALILDANKSFTGIADGSFQKIGVGTTSPQYGLQLVGAGTSGVIQSSGILIGASGIGVGTTTPVHPIDVVQHSGVVRASGMHSAISMNADAATVVFDLDQATTHGVTLGNNRTLALSNVQIGDKFLIRLQQDGTGSRTVTWFDHISWAGGSAPTLTTTANKADIIGFLTASGAGSAYWFDGLVVGQNI